MDKPSLQDTPSLGQRAKHYNACGPPIPAVQVFHRACTGGNYNPCFFGRIGPSDAATESLFVPEGNPKNEIARFRTLRSQILAISKLGMSSASRSCGSTAWIDVCSIRRLGIVHCRNWKRPADLDHPGLRLQRASARCAPCDPITSVTGAKVRSLQPSLESPGIRAVSGIRRLSARM